MATISTTDMQYILDAIATRNIALIKGIAETTVLNEDQIRAILFSGSLEVVTAMIKHIPVDSGLFAEVSNRAVTFEELQIGKTVSVLDAEGSILPTFIVNSVNCGEAIETEQAAEVRYAKDNIAALVFAINLDGLDSAAVTLEDVIHEIELAILSNMNAPVDVVTEYLTDDVDAIRAAAFVHPNTNNDEIVAVMTAEDAAGNNIDGFKLAMIALLNSDTMVTGNDKIVAYLMGATQSTPVSYAMFKNYTSVVLNGGAVVAGVDVARLIATYVK